MPRQFPMLPPSSCSMGLFTWDPGYKYPLVLLTPTPPGCGCPSYNCCIQMRFRGLKVYSGGTWELVDGYAAEAGFYDNFHLPPHGIVNADGLAQAVELQRGRPPAEIWVDSKYLYDFYTDVKITPEGAGFYALTGTVPTGINIKHGRGNGLMTIESLVGKYSGLVHRCEKWCEAEVQDIVCLN